MSRNVELKAWDRDPAATLERAIAAGAAMMGTLEQRDTYFAVPRGRLKLREEAGRPAALIAYERDDEARARPSDYEVVRVPDAAAVHAELGRTLGVRAVVEKTRRLLLWEETVRIHLDDVRALGSFLEIEAVAAAGFDLAREREQVRQLSALLRVAPDDVLAVGYADLLLR